MSSDWNQTTWGDIATLEYGKALRDYQKATGAFPVYGTNGPIGYHDKALCETPGVVIGRKGAYRGVHYSSRPFFVIDTAFYLKPKGSIDMRWAYYALLTCDINGMDSGSAIPSTSREEFYKLPALVPPLVEQKRIADFLALLDDRITLLRETNTTLEAIAQALFKSWFVDFDPVHAKIQGSAPEGMDEATVALFPDSFEEAELGAVPKGWSISSVADVAEIIKGKSYSSKDLVAQNTTALVTLKSFERGGGFRMDGFKPYSGAFKPTQVVTPGDLIVAYTDVTQAAELIGKPAIVVGIEEHDTLVASLDVGIVRPDFSKCSRQFLYGLFKTDSFQSHTLAHTSGTTVLHLSKDGVGSYQFVLPPVGLINVFEEVATALAERRQINSDQVRTLMSLRDTLLPRLISGRQPFESNMSERAHV